MPRKPSQDDPLFVPEGSRPEEFLTDAQLIKYYELHPDEHPHAEHYKADPNFQPRIVKAEAEG